MKRHEERGREDGRKLEGEKDSEKEAERAERESGVVTYVVKACVE